MFENEFEKLLIKYQDAICIRSRFSGLIKDYFPGQRMQCVNAKRHIRVLV